ncbi:Hsp20/alpha crystallin family protein [Waterburya agarophytonicola K14]|uniref:Hsp20/alpha crystallin family protein n=1 Tax=Waterburya agarophytonicola KI4 TaxID=2874699 RepID=A0A964BTT2_9CYAN|nr:Hsp20/alpha crystallin family protein [Waterburya agarophytonicola]MCC0178388.1 Hsp20/alpha crystallin family protein [Waterburya agarophytonicola KI4]
MKIVSFSPFEQMDSLRNQIDRVFNEMEGGSQNYNSWQPPVELLDHDDKLIVRLSLAGVDRQNIDIEARRKSVTVSGERRALETESSRYSYSEFNYGKFYRQISLPVAVVNTEVKADYTDGILTLILPKVEEAKQKVVKINLEQTNPASSLPKADSEENLELASA